MTDTITKQEPKLSVRKPGHWRNKWRSPIAKKVMAERISGDPDDALVDDDTIIETERHPSEEAARTDALEQLAKYGDRADFWRLQYLGPQLFPEGDEQ